MVLVSLCVNLHILTGLLGCDDSDNDDDFHDKDELWKDVSEMKQVGNRCHPSRSAVCAEI